MDPATEIVERPLVLQAKRPKDIEKSWDSTPAGPHKAIDPAGVLKSRAKRRKHSQAMKQIQQIIVPEQKKIQHIITPNKKNKFTASGPIS